MSYDVQAILRVAKKQIQSSDGCLIHDRLSGGSFKPVAFSIYSDENATGRYSRVTVHRESLFPNGERFVSPLLHVVHLDARDNSLYFNGDCGMEMVHLDALDDCEYAYRVYPETLVDSEHLPEHSPC